MHRPRAILLLCLTALAMSAVVSSCGGDNLLRAKIIEERAELVFGPADGHDLPPDDLERVAVGDLAPDFTALALGGEPYTLSEFRGSKNVVLVFYRGHW